jgi:hypothetical protein
LQVILVPGIMIQDADDVVASGVAGNKKGRQSWRPLKF